MALCELPQPTASTNEPTLVVIEHIKKRTHTNREKWVGVNRAIPIGCVGRGVTIE